MFDKFGMINFKGLSDKYYDEWIVDFDDPHFDKELDLQPSRILKAFNSYKVNPRTATICILNVEDYLDFSFDKQNLNGAFKNENNPANKYWYPCILFLKTVDVKMPFEFKIKIIEFYKDMRKI